MTGKGTREGLFKIRIITERYLDLEIDLSFDRVDHIKLIESLKETEMCAKKIRLIRNIYWSQKAFVETNNDNSKKPISTTSGVRQGCVLSPLLFNWYTERIFRKVREKSGVSIGGHVINNIRYADDTVLLAISKEDLEDILETVNREGEKYGMRMKIEKTKSMILSRNNEKKNDDEFKVKWGINRSSK